MTREKRKEALRDLWRKVRMLFALWRAVRSGQVISMDVELRGSVLLDHGFWSFGTPRWWSRTWLRDDFDAVHEDDNFEGRPILFLVAHMDSIEILQIDETYTPEDGE